MSRIRVPRISIEYGITQDQPTSARPVGKFVVSLCGNKHNYYVGVFANLEVARIGRNAKMRELGLKAKSTVAGAEYLPDNLKLPAPEVKKAAIPKAVKKAAIPKAVKTCRQIDSLSQKFNRQQPARRKELAVIDSIDSMLSDTVSRTYHRSLYRDDGKDYTPVYRHRGM